MLSGWPQSGSQLLRSKSTRCARASRSYRASRRPSHLQRSVLKLRRWRPTSCGPNLHWRHLPLPWSVQQVAAVLTTLTGGATTMAGTSTTSLPLRRLCRNQRPAAVVVLAVVLAVLLAVRRQPRLQRRPPQRRQRQEPRRLQKTSRDRDPSSSACRRHCRPQRRDYEIHSSKLPSSRRRGPRPRRAAELPTAVARRQRMDGTTSTWMSALQGQQSRARLLRQRLSQLPMMLQLPGLRLPQRPPRQRQLGRS
mmetsp:Transcript_49731/g.125267  ORF Transcript_49731/g.125267 Transcript_49731/m.125267 type:complete len:251 (-) Transcript_49731:628-1380(-)